MRNTLVVPIAVDVLTVTSETRVSRPMADFSRLPYSDGLRDINPARPFTTERIATSPFEEDASGWLPEGLHVRWELPDPLSHGRQSGVRRDVRFPRIPNRWLVRAPDESWWVVESDYVHPEGARVSDQAVAYLLSASQRLGHLGGSAAYRYVGRQLPLEQWREQEPGAQYLEDLTALGWGHPSFATFYPNCWSMLGFHTSATQGSQTKGELYGWYADPRQDPLYVPSGNPDDEDWAQELLEGFGWTDDERPEGLLCAANWTWPSPAQSAAPPAAPEVRSLTVGATGGAALADYLGRQSPGRSFVTLVALNGRYVQVRSDGKKLISESQVPGEQGTFELLDLGDNRVSLRAYNGMYVAAAADKDGDLVANLPRLTDRAIFERVDVAPGKVAFRASGGNFVVAQDAGKSPLRANRGRRSTWETFIITVEQHADTEQQERITQQLEAFALRGHFEPGQPDTERQLAEARHAREFVASRGGWLWTIRAQREVAAASTAKAKGHQTDAEQGPSEAYRLLSALNEHQATLDRLARKQDVLSAQLFCDWSKYLESKYPPRAAREDYPDPNEVRAYIERTSLGELEANFKDALCACEEVVDTAVRLSKALTAYDVRGCEIRASEILDWTRAAALASNGFQGEVESKAHAVAEEPDDLTRRDAFLESLNRIVRAREDSDMFDRSSQEHSDNVEGHEATDRLRAIIVPRVGAGYDELWQRWLRQAKASVDAVAEARRNRAQIEAVLGRALAVAPSVRHSLDAKPGPRFWEPRDPVLLLERGTARRNIDLQGASSGPLSVRCGRDLASWLPRVLGPGLSSVRPAEPEPEEAREAPADAPVDAPADAEDALAPIDGSGATDLPRGPELGTARTVREQLRSVGRGRPSRGRARTPSREGAPVLVDWKVAFFEEPGLSDDRGLTPAHHAPKALVERYELREGSPELQAKRPNDPPDEGRTHVVSGRSMLSEHPVLELAHAVAEQNDSADLPLDLKQAIKKTVDLQLRDGDIRLQSISLSGFHESLLMHEAVLPLPIRDPLGFADQQPFAARVRRVIGRHAGLAPRPLMPFKPVRAGRLQLLGLRFVDAFGCVQDLNLNEINLDTTRSPSALPTLPKQTEQTTAYQGGPVYSLPPRLVPPARLSMRWLAADDSGGAASKESLDHPSAGVVCGWLVTNLLDQRIMVHRSNGEAIGSIDAQRRWWPAPGAGSVLAPARIEESHLRRVVVQLLTQPEPGPDGEDFVETMRIALESIEPQFRERHRALALLMGRPVAIIRARIRLELLGEPPVDQSWPAFRRSLKGHGRSDAGLRQVRFPLRIGERGQLDDGVVGFWQEDGDGHGFVDNRFYAPQAEPVAETTGTHESLIEAGGGHVTLSLDAPSVTLTMLVDPRGTVHATTGVLPTKVLDIPDAQFMAALHNIEVTFLTAPLLTQPGTVEVNLPTEPGYAWSWKERTAQGWTETPGDDLAEPPTGATLGAAYELREGWLTLRPEAPGDKETDAR